MRAGRGLARSLLPVFLSGALSGCAGVHTQYVPQEVARGELTLSYDGRFAMSAGGRQVARGLRYKGLAEFVRCVPAAEERARAATRNGEAAIVLSVLGASFGVLSLGGVVGAVVDENRDHLRAWLFSGLGVALAGTLLAGSSRLLKNSANGHAVDALNFYNDAVGSLGASCDELRYPAPAGPLLPQLLPSPPPGAPPPPTPLPGAPPPAPPAPSVAPADSAAEPR